MEQQFLISDLEVNSVIHTPTKEESLRVLKLLDKEGFKWFGGSTLLEDDKWELGGEYMSYILHSDKRIRYSNRGYYEDQGNTIYKSTQIVESKSINIQKNKHNHERVNHIIQKRVLCN